MDIGTIPSLGSFRVECGHYIPHSRQYQKKKELQGLFWLPGGVSRGGIMFSGTFLP